MLLLYIRQFLIQIVYTSVFGFNDHFYLFMQYIVSDMQDAEVVTW